MEKHLKQFLDENHVHYVTLDHPQAFTAQEVAASAHIPGKEMAKTVMVKLDGELAMAVLPAPDHVSLRRLREATGAHDTELADEEDFRGRFPDCEVGAMPPFGNLWGGSGLRRSAAPRRRVDRLQRGEPHGAGPIGVYGLRRARAPHGVEPFDPSLEDRAWYRRT